MAKDRRGVELFESSNKEKLHFLLDKHLEMERKSRGKIVSIMVCRLRNGSLFWYGPVDCTGKSYQNGKAVRA